jgi:superoxide dismutase
VERQSRNGCLGTCLLFALQNRRPDYIEAFNVINWTEVSRRFASEK